MNATTKNISLVNNTGADIKIAIEQIHHAIKTLEPLPEEVADLFELTVLVGFNPDGSNRGILNWAK